MTTITRRSELLFLYDITHANPNGDPNDENKPRLDEETGRNIVTDVRLKRTIRDYLHEAHGKELFVIEVTKDDGNIKSGKERALDFGKKRDEIFEAVLTRCIDVRLFGATIPLEKDSITFTGPVQFKMGQSLHAVKTEFIKGTGAFASTESKSRKAFREEHILAYSLIAFHGIVNEQAARHTRMTGEDEALLLKAIWNGTKGLISRSKFGQMPRLLVQVTYKTPHFFIGDLDRLVKLSSDKLDEELRSPVDYRIDLEMLLNKLEKEKTHIDTIRFAADDALALRRGDESVDLRQLWSPLEV